MFTNVKFEVSPNAIDNSADIVELDMESLSNIGGGDGSTSSPFVGQTK
jgi:hypothetical protein